MKVFNTLGRRMEEFVPLRSGEVRIYVCGPTVYDYIHIGNARAFVVADVVRRYLEYKGFRVKYVSNITDIDDKMINRAKEMEISIQELGELYSDAYFEDIAKLNVKKPDVTPRVTQHIPEIIEAIETLVEKGYAYAVDGDVYFDVSKFEEYGKLSGNKAEALEMGARIEVNPKKKDPADFALWKGWKSGEPGWHSPWGKGRPGWHIECSTIAQKYLGETLDIHMGGKDLIFPHHENEIAQAEAATGKTFVRYWLHNEWLTVEGEKMSKSLGNFITVRDALKMCSPAVLRFFLLSAHYRSPLDFNKEALKTSERKVERLIRALKRLNDLPERDSQTSEDKKLLFEVEERKKRFEESMDDDFNTSLAIFALFSIVKSINNYADANETIGRSVKQRVLKIFTDLLDVLGIEWSIDKQERGLTELLEAVISILIDVRDEMRRRKEWEIADSIRERLKKIGVILEDAHKETRWTIKSQCRTELETS
ncbi:TPA: cysteine--tRNA ligase [Candidatus Bathyarchaeota archaeon]|nr:cysteine--tRNA ligase [Candidatus Bathyarchaeota archaeon]